MFPVVTAIVLSIRIDPGRQLDGPSLAVEYDFVEGIPAGHHGEAEHDAGDHRRCPAAQRAAEEPGQGGAKQGQEYGRRVDQSAVSTF